MPAGAAAAQEARPGCAVSRRARGVLAGTCIDVAVADAGAP
jgi:hypothetical protein